MRVLAFFRRRKHIIDGMEFDRELTFVHTQYVTYYLALSKQVQFGKCRINALFSLLTVYLYYARIELYLPIPVTCGYKLREEHKFGLNFFFLGIQIRLLAFLIHERPHMNMKKVRSRGVPTYMLLADGVLKRLNSK